MSLTNAPRLLKAAFAVARSDTGALERMIPFQYNPSRLQRSIVARDIAAEGDPTELLRLAGAPIVTVSLEAFFDATDALEEAASPEVESGVAARLAALERLVTPSLDTILETDALADRGSLELLPPTPVLTLLVWSANRVAPVRLRDISVDEEFFNQDLDPIRARVSVSAQILTSDDLGVATRGGGVFLANLANQERLAGLFVPGTAPTVPLGGVL